MDAPPPQIEKKKRLNAKQRRALKRANSQQNASSGVAQSIQPQQHGHTIPLHPTQIDEDLAAASKSLVLPGDRAEALQVQKGTDKLNFEEQGASEPSHVRPLNNPTGQLLPPFSPRWVQRYAKNTSEHIIINTLALDGPRNRHHLNRIWEQLDGIRFNQTPDDKRFKTSIIAQAKQLLQCALDMYFTQRLCDDEPVPDDVPWVKVRLGYLFRTHAKGFMINFCSDDEMWLAKDHLDNWALNLHNSSCGGFGKNAASGPARLFEIWGGIVLKNVQLSERILHELFKDKVNPELLTMHTQQKGNRPRFDDSCFQKLELENPMYHVDGHIVRYRVRRIEYLGGARRGHTINIFLQDKETCDYFLTKIGFFRIFGQIVPVLDYFRQDNDNLWDNSPQDLEFYRQRNISIVKEMIVREKQAKLRAEYASPDSDNDAEVTPSSMDAASQTGSSTIDSSAFDEATTSTPSITAPPVNTPVEERPEPEIPAFNPRRSFSRRPSNIPTTPAHVGHATGRYQTLFDKRSSLASGIRSPMPSSASRSPSVGVSLGFGSPGGNLSQSRFNNGSASTGYQGSSVSAGGSRGYNGRMWGGVRGENAVQEEGQ